MPVMYANKNALPLDLFLSAKNKGTNPNHAEIQRL
jgi:hypothetical protein